MNRIRIEQSKFDLELSVKHFHKCASGHINLLATLEEAWKQNKCKSCLLFEDTLYDTYHACQCPYEISLFLSMYSFDFHKHKQNNLSHTFLLVFEKWLKENDGKFLIPNYLKEAALVLSTRQHSSLLSLVIKLYDIRNLETTKLVQLLDVFLHEQKYKAALIFVQAIDFSKFVRIKELIYQEILLPLFLIEDLNPIKLYLKSIDSQEMQLFFTFLDSNLVKIPQLRNHMASLHPYFIGKPTPKAINFDNVESRIKTMLGGCNTTYNMDMCPNLTLRAILKAFNYFLYKFAKKGISEATHDKIKLFFEHFPYASTHLITTILGVKGLRNYALYWYCKFPVLYFNPPPFFQDIHISRASYVSLSSLVLHSPCDGNTYKMDNRCNCNSANVQSSHYPLNLPPNHLHMVSSARQFSDMIKILEKEKVLGIDAEWNPSLLDALASDYSNEVAIFQIASKNAVYLLDMPRLIRPASPSSIPELLSLWGQFEQRIFKNPDILILGYAFANDCSQLSNSVKNSLAQHKSLLSHDISTLNYNLQSLSTAPNGINGSINNNNNDLDDEEINENYKNNYNNNNNNNDMNNNIKACNNMGTVVTAPKKSKRVKKRVGKCSENGIADSDSRSSATTIKSESSSKTALKSQTKRAGKEKKLGDFAPAFYLDLNDFKITFDTTRLPNHPNHQLAPKNPQELARPAGKTFKKNTNEKGLSELVFWCFGSYLDKSEQVSYWENRPLREAQLTYAALDAFCLVEIYNYLTDKYFNHNKQPPKNSHNIPQTITTDNTCTTKSSKPRNLLNEWRETYKHLLKPPPPPKPGPFPANAPKAIYDLDSEDDLI